MGTRGSGERLPRPEAELSLRSPRKEDGAEARAVRRGDSGLIPSGMRGNTVAVCSPGPEEVQQVRRMVTDRHLVLSSPISVSFLLLHSLN